MFNGKSKTHKNETGQIQWTIYKGHLLDTLIQAYCLLIDSDLYN